MSEPTLSTAQPTPAAPVTLLLVDDEPSVLSALRRLFRTQGYQIQQATSGRDGLALLREHAVDLVVSDMRMPEMDGAAFLEAVRARHPGTVRILLTGYADITSTIAAVNRGEIHRYIAKPWNDQDLLLVVREALARQGLERQNRDLQALTQRQNDELRDLNLQLEGRVAARTAELGQVNAMLNMAYQDLSQHFTQAMAVFASLLELRQDGMAGHSRRVANLAEGAGRRLGLQGKALQDLKLAALLHDIGKIGFPDRMLGRAVSTFSAEELSRYRRHPQDGEAALLSLGNLQGVATAVRQHHERVDGKGFPDGLAGEEICLAARVLAVCSDYDGQAHGLLSTQRQREETARQNLRGGAGTYYDHAVVDAVLEELEDRRNQAPPVLCLDVRELKPGMVLAQDLLSSRGLMLLAAGHVFDARVIRQLVGLAERENLQVELTVHHHPAATAPAGRTALPKPTQP